MTNTTTAPEPTIATMSKRDHWKATTRIQLLATTNPKKIGSASHERFEGYFTLVGDCVVQDAIDAGLRMDDIRHDHAHGFIDLAEEGKEFTARPREMTAADIGL